jgi:hypothetical protein
MLQTPSHKKRNYASPQKTQTSIVTFYSNSKKQNNSATPPRSAIDRSYLAINTGAAANRTSPPKTSTIRNNPYSLLADTEDDDNPSMGDQTSDGRTENSATMVSVSSSQATPGKSYDNSVQGSSTIEDPMSPLLDQQQDQDSIATTKKLLSRKALKALRRIRMAKKLLLEDDIRAELAEVFGNTTDLSDELNLPISKNPVQEDVEMSQNDDGSSASLSSNSTHQQQTASTGQHAEVTTKSTKDTTHKNTNSGTGQTPSTNRNVTFAEATANRNCNNLRKGNLQGTPSTPINPYLKKQDQGTYAKSYPGR